MEVSTAQQGHEEVPTTEEPLTNVEQPTEEPNGMDTISMPDSESHTAHVFMALLLSVQVLGKRIHCHQ